MMLMIVPIRHLGTLKSVLVSCSIRKFYNIFSIAVLNAICKYFL